MEPPAGEKRPESLREKSAGDHGFLSGEHRAVEAFGQGDPPEVKRCIPWEIFKKHGVPEMGLMFCACDFEATKAINPG